MIIKFKSAKPYHKFNPWYEYDIWEGQINVEGLANTVLEIEKSILDETEKSRAYDGDTGLGKDSLTSRFAQFNLFQIEETKFLGGIVKNEVQLYTKDNSILYGQCWANVMRKGEAIGTHSHAIGMHAYLSGNIAVQTIETSTYYLTPYFEEIYESKNEDGKITLFPSWVKHYTDAALNDIERITIGFDLVNSEGYEKGINDMKKDHWEKLQ